MYSLKDGLQAVFYLTVLQTAQFAKDEPMCR
jgi:hypothetical protein